MTELSVIIPSYRAPQLLQQALASLGADVSGRGSAEVIVVDDGTPDFDPEPLRGLTDPLPLQIIHLPRNRGRAVARNAGWRRATGRIVVFLDGDMTVQPGFLAAHAGFHQKTPDAVAVGDIRFGPQIQANAMTRYIHSRGVSRFNAGEVPFKCFVTGNSSVPRQALIDVDGFDEAFVTYGGEDLELGYRLHQRGLCVHYLPSARSLHHQVRPYLQMGEAMQAYGQDSVPLLLSRHPELNHLLRLGFLDLPRWHPRRCALQLALHRGILATVHAIVRCLLPWRLPSLFFDYLWWAHRTHGYLQSVQSADKAT